MEHGRLSEVVSNDVQHIWVKPIGCVTHLLCHSHGPLHNAFQMAYFSLLQALPRPGLHKFQPLGDTAVKRAWMAIAVSGAGTCMPPRTTTSRNPAPLSGRGQG